MIDLSEKINLFVTNDLESEMPSSPSVTFLLIAAQAVQQKETNDLLGEVGDVLSECKQELQEIKELLKP